MSIEGEHGLLARRTSCVCAFTAEDVLAAIPSLEDSERPIEAAQIFLDQNYKSIEEAMCRAGFEAMETCWLLEADQ